MAKTYYTFRIRLANDELVRVEKWDDQHQSKGEPLRPFRYKEKLEQINPLLQHVLSNELNNSQQARELGEALFEAIFDDVLCHEFVNFYQEAVRVKKQLLRIELDVDEQTMPEVAALPWEFMCLPASANLGDRWLATDPNMIFSRRRTLWHSAPSIQLEKGEKLKIALALAAPQDLGTVKYEEVQEALESLAQAQAERIELLPIVNPATATAIDKLLEQHPHIFHFIGHGQMQNKAGEEVGQIALMKKVFNTALWMDASSFSELFNRWSPGVVLLQACESGMLSASRAFAGTASKIVQMNIPVVVAMQYEVSNITASQFAYEFYERLAKGEPVDIAAQNGRRTIGLETQHRKRDFATPVIFMRVTNGYLFKRQREDLKPKSEPNSGHLIESSKSSNVSRHNLKEAPSFDAIYGREYELEKLQHWIVEERCRLVAITGMGGIGKTYLSAELCKGGIGKTDLSIALANTNKIQEKFKYISWISLYSAPSLKQVLIKLIEFLSNNLDSADFNNDESYLDKLLGYLRKYRCLIILDNAERILKGGNSIGQYQLEYEDYGQFFEKVGSVDHKSCLLITTREVPQEVESLSGETRPVRILPLSGIDTNATKKIFDTIGTFYGSDEEWEQIVSFYKGNPLIMEIVARYILTMKGGHLSSFLDEKKPIFNNLQQLLDSHFDRFSIYEKELMYWLAINIEPISNIELKKDLLTDKSQKRIYRTLYSLARRIPLEKSRSNKDLISLQPVLSEYMIDKLVDKVSFEIKSKNIFILKSHAIFKATAQDDVRAVQSRLIN